MYDFPLNKIIKTEAGFTCVALQLNVLNTGGLYLSEDDFEKISIEQFQDYVIRYYKLSKKLVVSSNKLIEENYCSLDFAYENWRCLICRKLCKKSEPNCFCNTYSKCWSPIDGKITGVLFSNECQFNYHFDNDGLSNLIL